ncbi:hypothetical protein AB1P65_09520 [Roseibium alexandrii]
MAIPDQNAFLANAGNADVAAYVNNGGNFQDWWNNYGVNENRQWEIPTNQAVGAGPVLDTSAAPQGDYRSRYHEIRGISGVDPIHDYTQTAVSTAAHKNPHHYVNPATGELNRDQLQQEIQSGAFRFNPDYYAAQNSDLAAAGITSGTDLMNHFLDYGWNEGRNYAVGDPGFKDGWSNASGNNMFGSHVTGNGVQLVQNHPDYNADAASAFWATQPGGMPQGSFDGTVNPYGGASGGWGASSNGGLGGLGGASYDSNSLTYDNINQWGQTAYNGAGAANNGFQAGQSTNQSPVYNPNSNGGQPRNGFGGPLGNNNPWSPTF